VSRRFGRNQRRKMREALEVQRQAAGAALDALTMANGLARRYAARNEELRAFFQRVRDALPQESALLPPGSVGVDDLDEVVRHGLRYPLRGRHPFHGSVLDLRAIACRVEEDEYHLQHLVHLTVSESTARGEAPGERGHFIYAVSDKALLHLGLPDEMIPQLATRIATDLARSLNEKYMRGGHG